MLFTARKDTESIYRWFCDSSKLFDKAVTELENQLVRQADGELKNPNEISLQIICVDVSKYLRFYQVRSKY